MLVRVRIGHFFSSLSLGKQSPSLRRPLAPHRREKSGFQLHRLIDRKKTPSAILPSVIQMFPLILPVTSSNLRVTSRRCTCILFLSDRSASKSRRHFRSALSSLSFLLLVFLSFKLTHPKRKRKQRAALLLLLYTVVASRQFKCMQCETRVQGPLHIK